MSKPITVTYTCPCGRIMRVTAYPIIPATRDSPEEGGELDPDICDGCGWFIDRPEVCQAAADKLEGLLSEKYEREVERE